MVLKLKSEQQTLETFLGSYWVHRNQYTPKKEIGVDGNQTTEKQRNGKKGFPPTPKLWL